VYAYQKHTREQGQGDIEHIRGSLPYEIQDKMPLNIAIPLYQYQFDTILNMKTRNEAEKVEYVSFTCLHIIS
jgi:flagellin-specific chaperone FliS